jgi:hypothetical protein
VWTPEVEMDVDLGAPQALAAQQFMEHKGVPVAPVAVEKLEGQHVWYFYYKLPEGQLELEVLYNGKEWETHVCTFTRRAG